MSTFYEELNNRGVIHQIAHPEELIPQINNSSLTLYAGFDPTSDSLHIGSLMPLLMLARFQQHGHKVIALLGGGTGLIGDPSGKREERKLLTKELLEHNINGIKKQISQLLDLNNKNGYLLDNSKWLCSVSLTDFLRDIGKHFSVNMMLEKDSVKSRISEHGISFTEFSYMLLQSYDYLHLYDHYQCNLQIGGSDQWGNITTGMDLIRRTRAGSSYALTFPLLTKADGSKFGKSEQGNIWLNPHYTSPYQFYQFFMRVEDSMVGKLLRFLTFLSTEEIIEIEKEMDKKPEERYAQKALATSLTTLIHGRNELDRVMHASNVLFGGSLESIDEKTLLEIFAEAPSTNISKIKFENDGVSIIDILVETNLSTSKGMARKDLTGGGIYINNIKTSEIQLNTKNLLFGKYLVLRKGKKNYHLVYTI